MEAQQKQQITKYLNLIINNKKTIVFLLLVAIVGGVGVYMKTPKVYQSSALIIYQRARINPGSSQMTPDVQSQTREIVATLTQQVTSRTSLEVLIKQLGLYKKARQQLPMEDVVDNMRQNHITIKPEKGDVFRVSYQGGDPKQVMQVANALAARFIEENLRYREEKATETSAYVEDELNMAKTTIDKKESAMRDYKLKYYNEMPQQLQVNMSRLNSLQTQLQNNQDSIQDSERTKILIQEQVSLRKDALSEAVEQAREYKRQKLAAVGLSNNSNKTMLTPVEQSQLELNKYREHLEALLLRYTEKHPEVKSVQKKLQQLEESHQQLVAEPKNSDTSGQEAGVGDNELDPQSYFAKDPQLGELNLQLKEVSYNITRLKKSKEEISAQIEQYQNWIERTPVREAEWTALTRNYQQLYDHYQKLVTRNIQADAAESLERRQKGSQFKIIDSAYFPEKPYKPDFKRIMLMAIALGAGLGGGLVALKGVLDTSFSDPDEMENYLGVNVICSLPLLPTAREQKVELIKTILWSCFFLISSGGILGGMLYLWKTGRIII